MEEGKSIINKYPAPKNPRVPPGQPPPTNGLVPAEFDEVEVESEEDLELYDDES